MGRKLRSIDVDAETADRLEKRAAHRGTSVSQLVAELVDRELLQPPAEPDELGELERRWAAVEAGGTTVSQRKVVRWLETWGTPGYRPFDER